MSDALSTALAKTLVDPLAHFSAQAQPLGVVGFDIPLDLLYASGRPFCHLPWQRNRKTPLADRWLESAFPQWARSILEDWQSGRFDKFEAVIFTRGDDAAQRLYYYLCELRRRGIAKGPEPLLFDIAAIRRTASIKHCERAIRSLLTRFEVAEQALTSGIELANRQRTAFADLAATRRSLGHVYENIVRASLFRDVLPLLDGVTLPSSTATHRLLLAGSVPPDDHLHLAVEALHWNVVAEFHQLTLTRHGEPLEEYHANAVSVLAQHCNALSGGPRDFADRANGVVDAAQRAKAHAVVLWLTEEDEALAWHVVRQRAALEAAKIPHLVLTRRRWDFSDNTEAEIARFLQEQPA